MSRDARRRTPNSQHASQPEIASSNLKDKPSEVRVNRTRPKKDNIKSRADKRISRGYATEKPPRRGLPHSFNPDLRMNSDIQKLTTAQCDGARVCKPKEGDCDADASRGDSIDPKKQAKGTRDTASKRRDSTLQRKKRSGRHSSIKTKSAQSRASLDHEQALTGHASGQNNRVSQRGDTDERTLNITFF